MAKNNGELLAKMNGNGSEKTLTIADQVGQYLASPQMKQQLLAALPKHMTPERISRIFLTTIRNSPDLMKCTLPSLMSCIVQAAQLGVEIGTLGQAYAVPFNKNIAPKGQQAQWVKEALFILGYRGMIDLARRTGQMKTIGAHPISENDTFRIEYGFESVLQHIPAFGERGKVVGFYAFAVTKDGGQYCEVMSTEQVNAIRDRSKAKDNGPWVSDWAEMGRKTVLRRLFKYLPCSIELQQHIRDDEEREFSDAQTIELNLGDKTTKDGGVWPALEDNAPSPVDVQGEEIKTAQEKLEAKRGRAEPEISKVIAPLPGGDEPLFAFDASDLENMS
ncbi:MAG: recombinase RecT [Hyphomicrobiaceae bacterium]|nr:MAG: recombinase RecT [Hyphomicrobiaceae bacterium]